MKRSILQILLNGKLEIEMWRFKNELLSLEPEEIIERAYEIDTKICICGAVIELSRDMSKKMLEFLITSAGTLNWLYEKWLQVENTQADEILQCMRAALIGDMKSEREKSSNGKGGSEKNRSVEERGKEEYSV